MESLGRLTMSFPHVIPQRPMMFLGFPANLAINFLVGLGVFHANVTVGIAPELYGFGADQTHIATLNFLNVVIY